MDWTIQKLINWSTEYFSQKEIPSARLDAELLLSHSLKLDRIQLYTQFDRLLTEAELKNFKTLLQRRAEREPLAYILGEKEFFSLKFQVNPAVLIPRPETEELVEWGLTHLKNFPEDEIKILDLATGSGCLLLALLHHLPSARGIGVDISGEALEIAAINAGLHGLEARVKWMRQDLSQDWSRELSGPFDLITANLPYVSESEYRKLQPEILRHEPKAALVPGPEGNEAFCWVLPHLQSRLKAGGLALFEMGSNQGEAVLALAKKFTSQLMPCVLRDLAGQDRVISLSLPQSP
jgi:release factor glutamine methyltransferase